MSRLIRHRARDKVKNKNKESGVITVEACTSLIIFIFAFYIVIELMKVFAVEACMHDVLTSVAMDVSMGNYYGATEYCDSSVKEKMSGEYRSMTGLVSDDYNDGRLNAIDSTFANPSYAQSNQFYCGDTDGSVLAAYHMKDQSNIKRIIMDEKVTWFNVDVRVEYGGRVVANGEYQYRLFDVPFFDDGGIWMRFEQDAVTYAWY